jgi:predicted HTH domain antitoxin
MSERLSIVIPSEMNEDIEKLQGILKMDKSTVIRHLLSKSIREVKIDALLNEYRKGKVSLGKAAELAGVNLWEFIEHCRKNQIKLDLTEEEAEMGIRKVEEINIQEYKKKIGDTIKSIEKDK